MAALSIEYIGSIGARKGIEASWAMESILDLRIWFALTQPARIIIFDWVWSIALSILRERISVIASSHSYAISSISSSESIPVNAMRLSISLFIALLSPEKEKSRESFSRRTSGKSLFVKRSPSFPLCSAASFEIFAHPGKPSHIIFATLSKHSPAASSLVWPINSRSNILFHK